MGLRPQRISSPRLSWTTGGAAHKLGRVIVITLEQVGSNAITDVVGIGNCSALAGWWHSCEQPRRSFRHGCVQDCGSGLRRIGGYQGLWFLGSQRNRRKHHQAKAKRLQHEQILLVEMVHREWLVGAPFGTRSTFWRIPENRLTQGLGRRSTPDGGSADKSTMYSTSTLDQGMPEFRNSGNITQYTAGFSTVTEQSVSPVQAMLVHLLIPTCQCRRVLPEQDKGPSIPSLVLCLSQAASLVMLVGLADGTTSGRPILK